MNFLNRLIEYSFYSLFLLVPLVFTSQTSELFEFNKMWLTFGLTLVIAFAWFSKMILQRRIFIQRTPLDIPIVLFLLSQVISTIFSLDTHVSIWGYYSRFNGGLLSIISYIFLYYAFLSNFVSHEKHESEHEKHENKFSNFRKQISDFSEINAIKMVKRLLIVSLLSGAVVVLWGLPSHFGYDPTCFIFRGSFDVSCWTDAFQPKVRIFSTLGQPDWLAAYLAILIPLSIAFLIQKTQSTQKIRPSDNQKNQRFRQSDIPELRVFRVFWKPFIYLLLALSFYLALLYTDARSGFLAIWIALIFFTAVLFFQRKKILNYWYVLVVLVCIGSITFFVGSPFHQLDKFTFNGIKQSLETKPTISKEVKTETPKPAAGEMGGTDSSKIRLIVWKGAIDAWMANPIFGTGVETFAFAYYKFRPIEHNMVSEWDFLYNKAHNEYLNYLTTTGIFGLGAYLSIIGFFLFLALKQFKIQNSKFNPPAGGQNLKSEKEKLLAFNSNFDLCTLNFALLAGYLSILITNFFGFSVVIINLYLFLIPAFVFILAGMIDPKKTFSFPKNIKKELLFNNCHSGKSKQSVDASRIDSGQDGYQTVTRQARMTSFQWLQIIILTITTLYLLLKLLNFWSADTSYALGHNLNRVGQYQEAYKKLHEAVAARGDEPTFKDEIAINDAIMAMAYASQKESEAANSLTSEAVNISNQLASEYPNNVVFAKTQVRLFYALAQADPQFFPKALDAIIRANSLAPTDAKVLYNLGLLYEQNGNPKKAIEVLEKATKYKPDYRDAFYALGLYYHELAIDKNGKVKNSAMQKKAIDTMKHLISLNSTDEQARQALKTWGE